MNKSAKDYIFYVNWADQYKNIYRVGFLAKIEQYFYLIAGGKHNAPFAYKRGYAGIPGFKSNYIYKSDELFDFFKSRILSQQEDECEQLAQNGGVSMVDSFSLEQVNQLYFNRYQEVILKSYQMQEEKEQLEEKRVTQGYERK